MTRAPRLDQSPHWKVVGVLALFFAVSVSGEVAFRVLDWRNCRFANLTDQEG